MSRSLDHDPTAPVEMLRRHQGTWHQRLAVGLSIDAEFEAVDASLVLCKGCGKWLQHQWSDHRRIEVPAALAETCRELTAAATADLGEFVQARLDLTEHLVFAANSAVAASGKATDRLLTIGVLEPGLWTREFDGRVHYESFCAAEHLAEQTGLTVIDAYSSRDIACGGSGRQIELMALWLLLADRSPTISTESRLVVFGGDTTELVWLPPSDGLDAEVPQIRYRSIPGMIWLKALANRLAVDDRLVDELTAASFDDWLLEQWNHLLSSEMDRDKDRTVDPDWEQQSFRALDAFNGNAAAALRTAWELVFQNIEQFARQQTGQPSTVFVLAGDSWRQRLKAHRDEDPLLGELGEIPALKEHGSFHSTLAGIMSLLQLDQFPSSLPWISGCESSRSLGRITPGSPTNWRRVILSMADFHPPAMRLRDAI